MSDESRHVRGKHKERIDQLARIGEDRPEATPMMICQVFDGGSLPTDPDRWYLTHPMGADGDASEGYVASLSVDVDTTIPVLVLNDAPEVDDILQAFYTCGAWIAEKGGGGGEPSNCKAIINFNKCGLADPYRGRVRISKGAFVKELTYLAPDGWTFALPGDATDYFRIQTIDPPPDRHAGYDATIQLGCGGAYTFNLPLAPGYICPGCSVVGPGSDVHPVPTKLHCTIAPLGSCDLTYQSVFNVSTGTYEIGWFGTITYDFAGYGSAPTWVCKPEPVTVDCKWLMQGGITGCGLTAVVRSHGSCLASNIGSGHGPLTYISKSDVPLLLSWTYISFNTSFFGNAAATGVDVTLTVSEA